MIIEEYIHILLELFMPNEREFQNIGELRTQIEDAINVQAKSKEASETTVILILNVRPKKYFEKYPKQHGTNIRISRKKGEVFLRVGIDKGAINEDEITASELLNLVKLELLSDEGLKNTKTKRAICDNILLRLEEAEL